MPKFLLDAQLPKRVKNVFAEFGFESLHTLDLPAKNRTGDTEILRISLEDDYIVVTKDSDFVESYHLLRKPKKLLFLSCGNISNPQLFGLLRRNMLRIADEFEQCSFIELNQRDIIIHS